MSSLLHVITDNEPPPVGPTPQALIASGVLDRDGAQTLAEAMDSVSDAARHRPVRVVVDLVDVVRCEPAAVGILARAHKLTLARGATVVVHGLRWSLLRPTIAAADVVDLWAGLRLLRGGAGRWRGEPVAPPTPPARHHGKATRSAPQLSQVARLP